MNVTPNPKMFKAMSMLVDATCGEEPNPMLVGPAANAVRLKRRHAFDILHALVAISMREGVHRFLREQQEKAGMGPARDKQDKNAVSQAKDDATAGKMRIVLPS